MSIQSVICSWIVDDADLMALVTEDRFRAIYIPKPEQNIAYQPALSYRVISTSHEQFIDNSYVDRSTFGFFSAAEQYDVAHDIADKLVARLYAGIGQTVLGSRIQEATLNDRFDDTEAANESGLYVVYVEFLIRIQ